MQDDANLLRIVDRARIELVYTRSSLRQFQNSADPEIVNSVGAVMSKCTDTIREAEKLIDKLK